MKGLVAKCTIYLGEADIHELPEPLFSSHPQQNSKIHSCSSIRDTKLATYKYNSFNIQVQLVLFYEAHSRDKYFLTGIQKLYTQFQHPQLSCIRPTPTAKQVAYVSKEQVSLTLLLRFWVHVISNERQGFSKVH